MTSNANAVQGQTIVDHEQYTRVEGEGSKAFVVYSDIDHLEQHMKELAPEDKDTIDEFIKGVRACTRMGRPIEKAPELYGRNVTQIICKKDKKPFVTVIP